MSRQTRFFFCETTSESKIIMSLTRRTFVKKSSYSAAAVTVLGAGVGLAIGGESGDVVYRAKYDIIVFNATDQNYKYPNTAAGKLLATAKAEELTGLAIKTGVWGTVVPRSADVGPKSTYDEQCFIIDPTNAITTSWELNADGTVSPHASNTEIKRITYQWLK